MDVCDDYDLLCRTFINGKIAYIPDPLYKYYFHEDNTAYGEKNKKIQELTHELHDKYIQDIVTKWCDDAELTKVDLCSCDNKPEGFLGIDKRELNSDDLVFDLDKPDWPLANESVGIFKAKDALEHLKDPINTMKEMYRCLAPYGWVLIDVPSTDGRGAFQDPTHVSFWNSNSFWYYTKAQQAHFIGTPVRFQLNRINNYFPSEWHKFHNILYTKAHLVKLPTPIGNSPKKTALPQHALGIPHGREI
jgi:SAM-dependent methyltransferase